MPFVHKMTDFVKGSGVAEEGRMMPLTSSCFSGGAVSRGIFFGKTNNISLFCAFIFTISAAIVFLSPEIGRTARLAGEGQPLPTATPQPVVRKDASAGNTTTPRMAGQAAPLRPVTSSPPRDNPAIPPSATSENSGLQGPGGSAPVAPAQSAPSPSASQAPVQGPVAASAATPEGSALSPLLQQPQSQPALPPQPPQPRQPTAVQQAGRYVPIDLDNVDIRSFIRFVSQVTGRNILLDERVKGKVTVISARGIPVDQVYNVFESILEVYGFTTVTAGEVTKVVPSADARGKNLELRLKREAFPPEDKVVTQILPLQHASPDDIKKVLDPLISKTSIIMSYPPTGMLIITDVQSNIKRLQDIVSVLDVDGTGTEIAYIPILAASATEIAKSLTAVFPPQRPGSLPIRVVADNRTNSIILLGTEQSSAHVKKLISLMDKDIPRRANTLNVYRLQNGTAEDMVKVLMNLPKESPGSAQASQPGQGAVKVPVLSKDLNVVADKATNTLIIMADNDDYKIIEGLIRKLDIPRPMVYIEALIMEVSANKNFNMGVEWRGLRDMGSISGLGPDATALGLAGFTGQSIIPQVNSSGTVSMPAGFSLGVIGTAITIGGVTFPNIGAVVQAFKQDSEVSILSNPQLLTLSNEDAEINVGKNVPYLTRSDTSVASPGQTFGQNFEYKDVGVNLKITPNINEDQFIRLKIDQQVTALIGETTATPTTLKRTARTTVVIKDNETVVIGGLLNDTQSETDNAVPGLGDIPLLGWLFKTKAQSRDKNNLFIFITPRIIRNPAEAAAVYQKKLDDIGEVEEGIIRMNAPKAPQSP